MAGKTSGTDLIDGLEGSEHAKTWAKAVVQTMTGQETVVDAATRMGCNESYFYKHRGEALQALIKALEPKKTGRKPAEPDPQAERMELLEEELLRAKATLEAASARVTIALGVPHKKLRRRPKGQGRADPPS